MSSALLLLPLLLLFFPSSIPFLNCSLSHFSIEVEGMWWFLSTRHICMCVCRCCRHCCCCCFSRVFFPSTEPFFSRVHFLLISSIMRYIVRISCLVYLVKRLLTVHLAYGIRVLEFGFEFEFGLMSLLYISYPPLETVFRVRIIRAFYLYMCVCVSAMVPLLLLPLLLTAVVVGSIQSLLFTF